jgi:site-specific recombinase XerD
MRFGRRSPLSTQAASFARVANDGIDTRAIQDWLGHVSITHTARYTALSQTRFKDFWQ